MFFFFFFCAQLFLLVVFSSSFISSSSILLFYSITIVLLSILHCIWFRDIVLAFISPVFFLWKIVLDFLGASITSFVFPWKDCPIREEARNKLFKHFRRVKHTCLHWPKVSFADITWELGNHHCLSNSKPNSLMVE